MPEIMSRAELIADLSESLHDASSIFAAENGGDFRRHLDAAAQDMGRVRPRTLLGIITLVADQEAYEAPADIQIFKSALWGVSRTARPWERSWTGRLPDVRLAMNGNTPEMHLLPAPTAPQISVLGSAYKFYYFAAHSVSADAAQTTIVHGDRGLLLLRAQAEAMRELAVRNVSKPVSMRDGISGGTRNGSPTYLFEALMKEFESRIQ
ncbi:hypothetical protein [Nitrosospira sp. Nsp1]|uniref:hypothetical protein n=1 Tax=Nitrosospira sp. Nsp1 TaxID=136547 RepID=UPI00088F9BAC|nr:hypothetical protein [Nitrosospira sp. Nsp1]SCX40349.1 hypothetical protein SAMN05720354_10395 [Nitrosospira sp. Nsp1]